MSKADLFFSCGIMICRLNLQPWIIGTDYNYYLETDCQSNALKRAAASISMTPGEKTPGEKNSELKKGVNPKMIASQLLIVLVKP